MSFPIIFRNYIDSSYGRYSGPQMRGISKRIRHQPCSGEVGVELIVSSPLSEQDGPGVVEARHEAGEEQPAEEGFDGLLPVDHRVDGNSAIQLTQRVGEHVEASEGDHHWPVLLNKLDVGEHG